MTKNNKGWGTPKPSDATVEQQAISAEQKGKEQYDAGNYDQALVHFHAALLNRKQLFSDSNQALLLNDIGKTYEAKDDLPNALTHYKNSANITKIFNPNSLDLANILNDIGIISYKLELFEQSKEYYKESLTIAQLLSNRDLESDIHRNIGLLYKSQDKFEESLQHLRESVYIKNELFPDTIDTMALSEIGIVCKELKLLHKEQGNPEKAAEYLANFQRLKQELGDDDLGFAADLDNMGLTYAKQGDLNKAIAYHEEALKITEARDSRGDCTAIVLCHLGTVHRLQNNPQQALKYCQESLDIVRQLEHNPDIKGLHAAILNDMGIIYHQTNEHDKELACRQEYLEITGTAVTYKGNISDNGIISGQGTAQFSDGSSYSGEWSNRLPHGRGTVTSNARTYDGEFIHGWKNSLAARTANPDHGRSP